MRLMNEKNGSKTDNDEKDRLEKRYSDRELFKRLSHYLLPYKATLIFSLILMLGVSLTTIIQPLILKIAIDDYIIPGKTAGLLVIALSYAFISLIYFIISATAEYLLQVTGLKIITDLRQDVFYHLQDLSMDYYHKESTGRIISRFTVDIEKLLTLLSSGLVEAFVNGAFLLFLFIVLLYLDLALGFTVFLLVPLFTITLVYLRIKSRPAWELTSRSIAKVAGSYQEAITGIRVSKAFVAEKYLSHEFDVLNGNNYDARMKALLFYAIMFPGLDMLFALSTAVVLGIGGLEISNHALTVGTLTAFLSYLARLQMPLNILTTFYNDFISAMASAERIFDLIDRAPSVVARNNKILSNVQGELDFQHVNFSYKPNEHNENVLVDFNLKISAKSTIAFVGHTGAGKTTITNLLCRFYDFEQGRILFDGVDIRELNLDYYRDLIAIIPQDSFLFSGTIRDNLKYGKQNATDEELEAALLKVGAYDFVMAKGLDAQVGERGSHLSMGERQLLCFARAILRDPKLLILDEATSSVDAHTELIIQNGLQHILKNRTSVIIAHRLSTIRNADQIIVLDKGRIEEVGTFSSLLEKKGIFYDLYVKQFS